MLNAFTAAVSPSVKRALALRPTLFTSLNTNMRSILFYAHSYSILCRFNLLVGLSGLEPPTSRLSGVRSNRLSYKPSVVSDARKFSFRMETKRFELSTPCLQGRCSPN